MITTRFLLRMAACASGFCAGHVAAAPRDVQITMIDFESAVLTLENLGAEAEPLDGWRFCSHDEDQVRRYSASAGLNGLTIAAGGALHFHFLNDAPAGDPERVNIAGRGNFATPLDSGAYAIQIYFPPVAFADGNTMADHLQWSIDGIDNTNADLRSGAAQSGGLWTNQSLWIATAADTRRIVLNELDGSELHGPEDYTAVGPPPPVPEPFQVQIAAPDGGGIRLDWEVQKGVEYEVLRSTDLENFSPLGTTTAGTFTDPEPPAERAFYQVVGRFPS